MRALSFDKCADDYIRRIDRLIFILGAMILTLAASLFS